MSKLQIGQFKVFWGFWLFDLVWVSKVAREVGTWNIVGDLIFSRVQTYQEGHVGCVDTTVRPAWGFFAVLVMWGSQRGKMKSKDQISIFLTQKFQNQKHSNNTLRHMGENQHESSSSNMYLGSNWIWPTNIQESSIIPSMFWHVPAFDIKHSSFEYSN